MTALDFLFTQLHNQFVGGGLVLMFTGSVIALLRSAPVKLFAWVKRRVTIEVEILNSDPLFDYVTVWLDAHPYSKRSRKLSAATKVSTGDDGDGCLHAPGTGSRTAPRVFLSPAPGSHWFTYRGNLLRLERHRDAATIGSGGGDTRSLLMKHEHYTITVLGKNQDAARALIEDIVRFGSQPSDAIRLFNSGWGYWKSSGSIKPRKLDSVVLPASVAEGVLADVRKFLASSDWYRKVGIPWHRGYLLHGVPGSGKTSLVAALAGELGMDLYLLNIGCSGMDDDRLSSLMADVRPGTIVLMEDVDCTFPDRDTDSSGPRRVTLSGLLNCLDGVQSHEGSIIFMTTNFKKKLDPALTRPGRVDVDLEFKLATPDQTLRLRDRIAPFVDDAEAKDACRGKSMAEVQAALLPLADREAYSIGLAEPEIPLKLEDRYEF